MATRVMDHLTSLRSSSMAQQCRRKQSKDSAKLCRRARWSLSSALPLLLHPVADGISVLVAVDFADQVVLFAIGAFELHQEHRRAVLRFELLFDPRIRGRLARVRELAAETSVARFDFDLVLGDAERCLPKKHLKDEE